MEVWPESLGAMLEYWYIESGLLSTIIVTGGVRIKGKLKTDTN